jgi:hypothetical protein
MQSVAGVPYNFDKPWPFWFFIGKIISKQFFGNEQQLEWLNATRVGSRREFIAFSNTLNIGQKELSKDGKPKLQVVEVNFRKPQPGEDLKLFWKPASKLICQRVRERTWIIITFYLFHTTSSPEVC